MSAETRTTLKTYFNTGDKPTETQFGNLIDSNLNLTDGGTVAGNAVFTGDAEFTALNNTVTLIVGDVGNNTTINTLVSGYTYHIGTTTGAVGATDDDDARTLKLPTPSAAGERIRVYWSNAAVINALVGVVTTLPATETITYYAYAQQVFIETATTATGTNGTNNTMVK